MKRLVILMLLVNNFLVAYNQIIKGIVLDKETRGIIAGAAVYFNGTFAGTLTDKNGNFRLDMSKNTSMPLSISALGYYSVTLNSYSTTDSIIVQLAPKTFDLDEVVIRDKSLVRERKSNIKIFKEVFLGTTSNAGSCKILNENDITFNYKTDKDTLRAIAMKPLKIENLALGYKITYYLENFEYARKNKTFFFRGNLVFDEEMPTVETNKQSYQQQRINAYKGSKMHFFRELWADNLRDAGFTVLDPSGNKLDYKKIVVEQNDHRKYLSFTRYLTIVYNPEHRDNKRNIYYYKNMPLSYNNMVEDNSSKIVFLKNRVLFDSTGYFDGSGIRWQGQMVTQRISDFLPYEFQLSNKFLPLTTSGSTLISDSLSAGEGAASVDSLKIIEKVYLHTDRTYYYPGNDIWFKAYLINAFDRSLADLSRNLHVELISPSRGIISERIIKLDSGLGNGDFRLPDSLSPGRYRLRAYTNYMRNFNDQIFFNKEITIITSFIGLTNLSDAGKNEENKVDLSFFPEGGSLVDNVSSIVAFKAVDAQGKGCDVSGEVYSSAGDKVTTFTPTHLGMGSFVLIPEPGLNYYSVVKGSDNNEIKTEIPKSFSTGVTLSASVNNDNEFLIKIRTNDLTLPLLRDNDLSLSISARKEKVKTISLRVSSLADSIVIPTDDLPDGIVMITLKTLENLPLAERLVFFQHARNFKINIQPDREIYKQRDPVSVKISISDDSINQETAFLSFSAAENNFMDNFKEFPTTISSWFLLESDIRGTVEGPSYYFDPANPDRFKDLDLLLRTQGWRDFSWKYDSSKYFSPETGFFVSGRLRKINRDKPFIDPKINLTIFQEDKIINEIVPADLSGRFYLKNIDITGDARLVASASDRKGYPNGLLLLDSMKYKPAEISRFLPSSIVVKKEEENTLMRDDEIKERETVLAREYDIKETIRKKYKLSDTIEIGEVTITAQRPRDIQVAKIESVRSVYGGQPDDEVIVTPQMENFSAAPELLIGRAGIMVVLKDPINYPGKYVIEFHREMRFKEVSDIKPLLIIDGIKHDLSYLDIFPIPLIERIDILKSAGKTAVFGLEGANGVISVITRSGNRLNNAPATVKHTVNTRFSGYDSPRIFYSPRYDPSTSDYNPNLRTTLFWKPDISLLTGKELLLNYFNADNSSTIRIIVEGITSTGIPVTATTEYQVTD
jgi:hypothetical protein